MCLEAVALVSRARPPHDVDVNIDEVNPWPATRVFSSSFDAHSSQKNPDGDDRNQADLSKVALDDFFSPRCTGIPGFFLKNGFFVFLLSL